MNWLLEHLAILITSAIAIGAVFFAGHNVGSKVTQSKADADKIKATDELAASKVNEASQLNAARIETVKAANDVQTKVNSLDAGGAADELRSNWSRDETKQGD